MMQRRGKGPLNIDAISSRDAMRQARHLGEWASASGILRLGSFGVSRAYASHDRLRSHRPARRGMHSTDGPYPATFGLRRGASCNPAITTIFAPPEPEENNSVRRFGRPLRRLAVRRKPDYPRTPAKRRRRRDRHQELQRMDIKLAQGVAAGIATGDTHPADPVSSSSARRMRPCCLAIILPVSL